MLPVEPGIPEPVDPELTGSNALRQTKTFSPRHREEFFLRHLRRGNIPSFLRDLVPVQIKANIRGVTHHATIFVMPDYLSLGNDKDWVRIPLTPLTAQRVADHFGYVIPTTKMVDEIYRSAGLKLQPRPMRPTRQMASNNYYLWHHRSIEKSLPSDFDRHTLLAGHKKDIVITNQLLRKRRRVAIYGWHRSPTSVIQNLSLVHDDQYADYSHGVRLVAKTMILNGEPRPVAEVLQDPRYAGLISYEGRLKLTRLPTDHAKWQ